MDTSQQSKIVPKNPNLSQLIRLWSDWRIMSILGEEKRFGGLEVHCQRVHTSGETFQALLTPSQAPSKLQPYSCLDSQTKGGHFPHLPGADHCQVRRQGAPQDHTFSLQDAPACFPPAPEQNCRCSSDPTWGKRLAHPAMPTVPSDGRLK